eukprot:scaffold343_cov245-Pinguiococcus_pyrenoidosus.AAC.2
MMSPSNLCARSLPHTSWPTITPPDWSMFSSMKMISKPKVFVFSSASSPDSTSWNSQPWVSLRSRRRSTFRAPMLSSHTRHRSRHGRLAGSSVTWFGAGAGASTSMRGSKILMRVPCEYVLSTLTSPPMMFTSSKHTVSPRPVFLMPAPLRYLLNKYCCWLSGIPGPVSCTVIKTASGARREHFTRMEPSVVNLTALASTFATICCNLSGSDMTSMSPFRAFSSSQRMSTPSLRSLRAMRSHSSKTAPRETHSLLRTIEFAAIFPSSSVSSITRVM